MPTVAPLVVVAHGSPDPRSAATMDALGLAVSRRWAGPVVMSYLDFNQPRSVDALREHGSGPLPPIVVPALLTRAFHGKVDIPQLLTDAGVPARSTAVLGPQEPGEEPNPLLLRALLRRLRRVTVPHDGLVLAAAGTRDEAARSTVDGVAAAVAAVVGLPCLSAYASGGATTGAEAVARLRGLGVARPAVLSYFLAPGKLHDLVVASAVGAGAVAVAPPLGDAPEIAGLIVRRAGTR